MEEVQKIKLLRNGRRGYCQIKGENRTHISEDVMNAVIERDKKCVYCENEFGSTRGKMATWEHINGKTKDVEEWNITLCCGSCNSSRGNKELKYWFKTAPRGKTINKENLPKVIKDYIDKYEKIID